MSRRDRFQHQEGFALASAIFVMVILGAMSAFLLTLSGVQSRSGIFALQGARAYHAAKSGIEWGIYTVVDSGGCIGPTTLMNVDGLAGFTVTVTCDELGDFTEGSDTVTVYRLTSRAVSGIYGSIDFVQRTLVADVMD